MARGLHTNNKPFFINTLPLSCLLMLTGFPFFPIWAQETSEPTLAVGAFSTTSAGGSFPKGWEPLTFEKIPQHTQYTLVKNGKDTVVKAVSNQSSSGMTRKIIIDPRKYPIVEWRWKIDNILRKGDVNKKEGDDYPARIYITFEYDSSKVGLFDKAKFELIKFAYGEYPPIGALNYIWESKAPVGTLVPNPYTDYVRMIVVESGTQQVGQWVTEERNVLEDYKNAFGEDPPNIAGIAIMTDTDNTGESAVSFFGDIIFKTSLSSK